MGQMKHKPQDGKTPSRQRLRKYLRNIASKAPSSLDAKGSPLLHHCLSEGLVHHKKGADIELTKVGVNTLRRLSLDADPFARQHQEPKITRFENEDGTSVYAAVNLKESPLAWLASRRSKDGTNYLSQPLLAAGERLRSDFERANLSGTVTMNWDHFCDQGSSQGRRVEPMNLNDSRLGARKRLEEAFAYVGPELAPILKAICCQLQKLEQAEQMFGWPRRSGKLVLKIALARLARHYGYCAVSQSSERGKVTQWGTEDYRPRHVPKAG